MADAKKPGDQVIKKRNRRSLIEHRTFDIKPAGTATPSATSRPVITATKPQQADPTLTPEQPVTAGLIKHSAALKPLTPGIAPAAAAAPPQPAAVTPPVPVTPPTPAAPAAAPAPVPVPAPVPAIPAAPVAAPVQPPVPDVSAPPTPAQIQHGEDELALANLTGVHGIVEKPAVTEAATIADGSRTTEEAVPDTKQMHQTPEQARKLAAALNDLSHHPAPAVDDRPVVVVHQHDYVRTTLIFLAFLIGGALLIAIVFDLLLDAGVLNLPMQPWTHFFSK